MVNSGSYIAQRAHPARDTAWNWAASLVSTSSSTQHTAAYACTVANVAILHRIARREITLQENARSFLLFASVGLSTANNPLPSAMPHSRLLGGSARLHVQPRTRIPSASSSKIVISGAPNYYRICARPKVPPTLVKFPTGTHASGHPAAGAGATSPHTTGAAPPPGLL